MKELIDKFCFYWLTKRFTYSWSTLDTKKGITFYGYDLFEKKEKPKC